MLISFADTGEKGSDHVKLVLDCALSPVSHHGIVRDHTVLRSEVAEDCGGLNKSGAVIEFEHGGLSKFKQSLALQFDHFVTVKSDVFELNLAISEEHADGLSNTI